jgi:hypothetical protein
MMGCSVVGSASWFGVSRCAKVVQKKRKRLRKRGVRSFFICSLRS